MPDQKHMMSHTKCDFCASTRLSLLYTVPDSSRGMKVMMCRTCGLVQSMQTKLPKGKKDVRISSDADWGNIRIGKSIGFERHKPILEHTIPWKAIHSVLDVGSSRGIFLSWMHEHHPTIKLTGVEPDTRVTGAYEKASWVTLYHKRLEDVQLPDQSFDLIYSSHTLEHVASAKKTLVDTYRLLKPGGYFLVDVPNIDVIADDDVVEEFFIDKHTFHFSRNVLRTCLEDIGFTIIYGANDTDRSNILFVAQKGKKMKKRDRSIDAITIHTMKKVINQYKKTLQQNRKKMKKIGTILNKFMQRQKVVFWGGGRIFDALVKHGGLDPQKAKGLIDTYLAGRVATLHGIAVSAPYILRMINPHVVIILAKSSEREIIKLIRRFGIVNIITFRDLIQNV